MTRILLALLAVLLVTVPLRGAEDDAELLFVRRIAPLLHEKCAACHGGDPDNIEGSLDLTSKLGAMRGGDSEEPALVAGDPNQSPLFLAIRRDSDSWSAMPPKDAERLTPEQIGWIQSWIAGGAPWPDQARQAEIADTNADRWSAEDGVEVPTSGGTSDEWTHRKYKPEGLWAYQPVRKPAVPTDQGSPIDTLINAALPAGLQTAERADRVTLIRRATFDLTGLPPTAKEVQAYLTDKSDEATAFATVVDRLLDSPHYGERMAQHWLDVVRYADSSGFANDYQRGNAWRYRDYVVRSFNADKRYDQFIREQLAGDELEPSNPEMLVATGFLRMGPWELTGMEVAKIARQRFLDDVTNSVGETFLAHSLQCARCHDHKFDPVPTRDYYSVQAVFATTQLAERDAPFLPSENVSGFDEQQYLQQIQQQHAAKLRELDEVLLRNALEWLKDHEIPTDQWISAVEEARQDLPPEKRRRSRGIFNAARNILGQKGIPEDRYPPKLVGFTPDQFGNERVARKGIERLRWELDRYRPVALSVYGGRTPKVKAVYSPLRMPADRMQKGELENTCILTGGDPFSPSEPVVPGWLSVIGDLDCDPVAESIEGRRAAFAKWVAHPQNPLTVRSIVNRVWLWHFNQALAGNPNNFGSTGKRPTHPDLLDWLAATFVEEGWSIKALHRSIMNSEAYCRSTQHPDRDILAEKDPTGESWAVFRPRRLTAEELRDAMLSVTGELNPVLGGIPCRPEINLEAALQPRQVMGTFARAWTPNHLPEQRHRRSLYVLKLRGLAVPMFDIFNAPGPDFSCEQREASTVTPQVFSLFNGQNTHARALALANRVSKETVRPRRTIDRLFEIVFSRRPTADERRSCLQHWDEIEDLLKDVPARASKLPLEVVREAVEENTGEKFTFREVLRQNADFVPDLQATDVDLRVRALADVCLALLNSNEFAYVY